MCVSGFSARPSAPTTKRPIKVPCRFTLHLVFGSPASTATYHPRTMRLFLLVLPVLAFLPPVTPGKQNSGRLPRQRDSEPWAIEMPAFSASSPAWAAPRLPRVMFPAGQGSRAGRVYPQWARASQPPQLSVCTDSVF